MLQLNTVLAIQTEYASYHKVATHTTSTSKTKNSIQQAYTPYQGHLEAIMHTLSITNKASYMYSLVILTLHVHSFKAISK